MNVDCEDLNAYLAISLYDLVILFIIALSPGNTAQGVISHPYSALGKIKVLHKVLKLIGDTTPYLDSILVALVIAILYLEATDSQCNL